MKKTPNQVILQDDIRRYKTNKLASSLALLAIVFNCLYFCLLYSFRELTAAGDPNKFQGSDLWRLGVSVVLTLVVLLFTFLCSEGIKNYNKKYAIPLLVIAAVQVIRMFGMPLEMLKKDIAAGVSSQLSGGILNMRYFGIDLTPTACYTILVVWLAASAACLIAAAIVGYINSSKLEQFNKKIESGEIVVENVLAELDKEDAMAAERKAVVAESAEEVQ